MNHLRTLINDCIDARLKELNTAIDDIEKEAKSEIQECENSIANGLEITTDILAKGSKLFFSHLYITIQCISTL